MYLHCFHRYLLIYVLFILTFSSAHELHKFIYTDGVSAKAVSDDANAAAAQVLSLPRQLQGKCSFGEEEDDNSSYRKSKVVKCIDQRLTDPILLSHLPTWTEVLIFTGNNLSDSGLTSNLLNTSRLRSFERLHTIDLSNNQLSSINVRSFQGLKSLRKLILNNNDLSITGEHFHSRIFSPLESLEELHLQAAFAKSSGDQVNSINFIEDLISTLEQANLRKLKLLNLNDNSIQSISNEFAFCSLPSLTKLYISGNALSTVSINVSCNPKLFLLDISSNNISSLTNKSLALFRNEVKFHVNLTSNPLRCDCRTVDLYRWIKDPRTLTWVIGNKTLECASGFPQSNIGKLFVSLHLSDLQCSSSIDDDNVHGYVTASFALIISLVLAIIVMITALVIAHKEDAVKVCSRISSIFSTKQVYTALNQEQHHSKIHQVQPIAPEATMTAAHLVHHHYHNVMPPQGHHFHNQTQQQQQQQHPQVQRQQAHPNHPHHQANQVTRIHQQPLPTPPQPQATRAIRSIAPGVEEISV